MKNRILMMSFLLFFAVQLSFAQGSTEYTGGFKVKLNDDGTKYFRTISWGQFWAQYKDNAPEDVANTNFSVRRARILTYAQLNKNFLIVTHLGLNSLNGDTMSPTGKGEGSQLFFHDFWGQWSLNENHAVGAGLHYWNGISRLNNQSTLNMLTLDNNRQSWATIGLSDQFARHIGVYLKGKLNKLQYRLAINEAVTSNLQAGGLPVNNGNAVYGGRRLLGSKDAGKTFAGYFDYQFLDQESNFLPYKVGTYLGSKKVFNIGAGFFLHPNGSVRADGNANLTGEDVTIFSVDAFYDAPINDSGAALTAYATYQVNDYGKNYTLGTTYESGSMLYAHVGYLIPASANKTRVQPYVSLNNRQIDAIDDTASRFGLGANLFFTGHHSKLTFEYSSDTYGTNDTIGALTVQAMIYL